MLCGVVRNFVGISQVVKFDTFKDPMDVLNLIETDFEVVGGTPYNYGHKWVRVSGISQ